MKSELPTDYHASRINYMIGNRGGLTTQNPTTHVAPTTNATANSVAQVVGRNSPTSLHMMFGHMGRN